MAALASAGFHPQHHTKHYVYGLQISMLRACMCMSSPDFFFFFFFFETGSHDVAQASLELIISLPRTGFTGMHHPKQDLDFVLFCFLRCDLAM
jgi:hypothetical protein